MAVDPGARSPNDPRGPECGHAAGWPVPVAALASFPARVSENGLAPALAEHARRQVGLPPRLMMEGQRRVQLSSQAPDALRRGVLGPGVEVEDLDGNPAIITGNDQGFQDRAEIDLPHAGA